MTRRSVAPGLLLRVLLILLHPGCTPAPSSAPAPHSPPVAGPVPLSETFALTQVRPRYDAKEQRLLMSYTVRNQGDSRVRAYLCVDLIDKDGYPVGRVHTLERISLGPGDSDPVQEVEERVLEKDWMAAAVLRVFVSDQGCFAYAARLRSAVLWLDTTGQPLPPGARLEVKTSEAEDKAFHGPQFQLQQVQVTQNAQADLQVSYLATNLTRGRVSGQLCVRLLADPHCTCQSLDRGESHQHLELGQGDSEKRTESLPLDDGAHWSKTRALVVYLARFGCSSSPEEASSNVVTLEGPALPQVSPAAGGRQR